MLCMSVSSAHIIVIDVHIYTSSTVTVELVYKCTSITMMCAEETDMHGFPLRLEYDILTRIQLNKVIDYGWT